MVQTMLDLVEDLLKIIEKTDKRNLFNNFL